MQPPAGADTTGPRRDLQLALAGLCATLVGIGLARFAYTPLLPALIEAGWFSPAEAAYLGAANLLGYLAGAVTTRQVLAHVRPAVLLRAMMALATLTFLACALQPGFLAFMGWRFLSGLSGGYLMVTSAPTVMTGVAAAWRARAGGLVFTGVGIGITLSGTLVPLLLRLGVASTWTGLGLLALALTAFAWTRWPEGGAPAGSAGPSGAGRYATWPVIVVIAIYTLYSIGLVPHTVFFSDYVARGLGHGVDIGAMFWAIYGLGAMSGPLLASRTAARASYGRAMFLGLALQLVGVLIPIFAPYLPLLALSAFIMGALTPGMGALMIGRLQEVSASGYSAWGLATTFFALAQAGSAYALSYLFGSNENYLLLFSLAAGALVVALALDAAVGQRRRG